MRLVQAACLLVVGGGALTIGATGCSAANQVRQIFMALDATGDRPRNTFFTDSTEIDCDIVWSGRGTDNSVDVVILQTYGEATLFDGLNDVVDLSTTPGQGVREWSASEQAPPAGISTIAFQYTPPQSTMGAQLPFPVGTFKCVVSVNGESAGEADFTVDYPTPDCPPGGVPLPTDVSSLGNSCVGYLVNQACPDASNTSSSSMCTCTGTGQGRTWTGCL